MDKIIIGIIVLALALGGGYFAYKNMNARVPAVPTQTEASSGVGGVSAQGKGTENLRIETVPADNSQSPADAFTMAQVATHNNRSDCYSVINGSVYNLTGYINQHPGGARKILEICGIDGTNSYMAKHGGNEKAARDLAALKIGTLAQ